MRLVMPSKSVNADVQCRDWPVSRPSCVKNRTIQSVARLETSCEPLPALLQLEFAGS